MEKSVNDLIDEITVTNLVDAYKGNIDNNDVGDIVLKAAILTVLKYFTTETEYASILTELLGD